VVQDEIGTNFTRCYGGLLTENEIQATARDVLRDAWIALAKAGYVVLFTVHDEIVVEVPDETVADAVPDIRRIMITSSPWAAGCPLGAKFNTSKVYCKD
jgi:DNA polymerase